jgi:Icc-related predicted phosphoesterase
MYKHPRFFAAAVGTVLLLATLLVAKHKSKSQPVPNDVQATNPLFFAAEPKQYPFSLIAYGDLRTTDPSNHLVADPARRQALIARIASEKPDLVLINGDLVYKGGNPADWQEFDKETRPWREAQIKILPVVGNHDTSGDPDLQNYFQEFPKLEGRRWYSVRYGNVLLLTLDSESDHAPGSPQWNWINQELDHVPAEVRFIIFSMHHPPYTQSSDHMFGGGHSARESEKLLAQLFETKQKQLGARIIAIAGHVHNYERYDRNGVMYIVSGGGGASPYAVQRQPGDFYNQPGPTYHYCKVTVDRDKLKLEMLKLELANGQFVFNGRDSFEITVQ